MMIPIGLYCLWRLKIFTETFICEYFRLQDRIKHQDCVFQDHPFSVFSAFTVSLDSYSLKDHFVGHKSLYLLYTMVCAYG